MAEDESDEALARRLQEELNAADRRVEDEDAALAQRLQAQIAAGRGSRITGGGVAAPAAESRSSSTDDEALAQRLQAQIISGRGGDRTSGGEGGGAAASDRRHTVGHTVGHSAGAAAATAAVAGGGSLDSLPEDPHDAIMPMRGPDQQNRRGSTGSSLDEDEALARRMQNLEHMGMGRLNSDRNFDPTAAGVPDSYVAPPPGATGRPPMRGGGGGGRGGGAPSSSPVRGTAAGGAAAVSAAATNAEEMIRRQQQLREQEERDAAMARNLVLQDGVAAHEFADAQGATAAAAAAAAAMARANRPQAASLGPVRGDSPIFGGGPVPTTLPTRDVTTGGSGFPTSSNANTTNSRRSSASSDFADAAAVAAAHMEPFPAALPGGATMANAQAQQQQQQQPTKRKKKRDAFLNKLGLRKNENNEQGGGGGGAAATAPPNVPAAIPPPARIERRPGPLDHSVSINRMIPMADHPLFATGAAAPSASPPPAGRRKKGNLPFGRNRDSGPGPALTTTVPATSLPTAATTPSKAPLCCVCRKPATSYLATLDKKYHPDCFRCIGCHDVIDPSGPFAFSTDENTGERHPLHRSCYGTLYGIKCAVCNESIPTGPDGKVSYVKHPFFDTEQMCPKHASNPGRRCTGCHRFEPLGGNGFADLGDANRCVCLACCRSVIVDSADAKPLWDKVVKFFEQKLQLPIWNEMRDIPVLVVGYDALNDQLQNSAHKGSSQIMTRGLCLSEHQSGRRIRLQKMKFSKHEKSFAAIDPEARGFTYFQVPDASKENPDSSVTAILCMSGLPADLTASVLAHEATHAWFKLHPDFDIDSPIPLQVEEGACQLVALLFLNDGLDAASDVDDPAGPSDEKLRQYFKFSIETDDNDIYGAGFRLAAKAYATIGIEALLGHIVRYKAFPVVEEGG